LACKGFCERMKASKPLSGSRYASGQKRCQVCSIYIKWEGVWCPCCSYRLRTKPRAKTYKDKLRRIEA
jgi:DNA-directed RNA polymerase subunit RPC12/RpoP